METRFVSLMVLDITGYTKFLASTDLIEAREIITSIFCALTKKIPKGLRLNKIEGDAMFFYSRKYCKQELIEISNQLFQSFIEVLRNLSEKHSVCKLSLCKNLRNLGVKFFLHDGEVGFQKIENFNELIGMPVIEIHRLMKNKLRERSYILVVSEKGEFTQKYPFIGKISFDKISFDST